MYNIPYYKETDQQVIIEFMRQHPFAMLIACQGALPVATQVPLLIEEKDGKILLQGHIMRGTDHHTAFTQNNNALCLFTGAHSYVSASLYTNPQTGSTWNYMSVHARVLIRFLEEEDLRQILEKTTAHFENNSDSPSLFHHLPAGYVDRMVKAIAGFRIEVEKIDAVFKLSQNRDEQSYHNIIKDLGTKDGDAQTIASHMSLRAAGLFHTEK